MAESTFFRALWLDPQAGILPRIRDEIARRQVHPARTVVLVPYAQLMPQAARQWAQIAPSGFAPRFETTMNWAARFGFAPGADDLAFDPARDLFVARARLERNGLREHAERLAGRLVESASQLAGVAAALPPAQRAAWAARARAAVSEAAPVLQFETAVALLAVDWAATSGYATDALLRPERLHEVDLLVVLEGVRAEPMAQAMARFFGDRAMALPMRRAGPPGDVKLYAAADPAQEAESAAARVLHHIGAGRVPVALAAIDRVLTRRVRAMLEEREVAVRDETGWKLSTTRAAAHVMAALRASAWNAGSDEVLDWLKNVPALSQSTVSALERRIRREGAREWRAVHSLRREEGALWPGVIAQADAWREQLRAAGSLSQCLGALRDVLRATGRWSLLENDAAGEQVLLALGLDDGMQEPWQHFPHAPRRLALPAFTAWVNDVLEAGSYQPRHPPAAQVVVLPFNQLLGREVGALVLAGCDEMRLPPSPEPEGPWTKGQRAALGLPARETLETELRAGWRAALQVPHCDVLWRVTDDSGEEVLPSALVQSLQLEGIAGEAADPRALRMVEPRPVAPPQPAGALLPVDRLSASAYADLRACPYKFFALRQLLLSEPDEIDADLDKRDFGNWLHRVLAAFHHALQEQPEPAGPERARRLDEVAQEVTRSLGLDEGEFLPFAAAWPQARDGYLAWLAKHESQGATFEAAESEQQVVFGAVTLHGRIDRIDRLPGGGALVMDYKTEGRATTARRIASPAEDTQLAFYAALLEDDTLAAAYVNVGERGKTDRLDQAAVVQARDLLVQGILHDLERVHAGTGLAALGEGTVCEFCAARGLCRRDFWS